MEILLRQTERFIVAFETLRQILVGGAVKFRALILIGLFTGLFAALAPAQDQPTQPRTFGPTSFADQFLEHNFVNFFAFTNGVYDTYAPVLNAKGQTIDNGGFGYTIGGGVTARHSFKDGFLSLSYSGDWRQYTTYLYGSGTDQNLQFSYLKKLNRRWILNVGTGAGIAYYGSSFLSTQSSGEPFIQNNPFSSENKFFSSGITLTYQQTRRLSYVASGNFFLQRFNFPGSIGTTGGSGSGSVLYRVTPRLTLGGSYAHSYYVYQRNSGTATVDGVYGNASYLFPNHWLVNFSGGLNHSDVLGSVFLPAVFLVNNQLIGGYRVGKYDQVSNLPAFSGSVTRNFRRSSFSVSGGQAVVSGNGYYLASNSQFFGGNYSRTLTSRKATVSASGYYNRYHSISNTVASNYTSAGFGASYGYNIIRHLAANFRYDFIRYGQLAPVSSVSDSRLSFGFSFSTQSIPLTVYQ